MSHEEEITRMFIWERKSALDRVDTVWMSHSVWMFTGRAQTSQRFISHHSEVAAAAFLPTLEKRVLSLHSWCGKLIFFQMVFKYRCYNKVVCFSKKVVL